MSSHQQHNFVWLDLVRGISAVAVCASHLRAAMFVDYAQASATGFWSTLFYALTGLGHQAVMVFFVLSGFFVGGSILRNSKAFRPGDYALARLSRLWVVLVPALAFTAIVDAVIRHVAPEVLTGEYWPIWNSGPYSASTYSASMATLGGNLLFLQTIETPVFGTNGPLWSLANEFWYYVLFPLCVVALGVVVPRGASRPWHRLAAGAVALLILAWLPPQMAAAFPIWLLGLVVYATAGKVKPILLKALLILSGLALFVATLLYSKSGHLHGLWGFPPDLAVGLGFCLLCIGLTQLRPPARGDALWVRASQGLSAFSYSLYLVHFPLVALIGAVFYGKRSMQLDAASLTQFSLWLLLLLGAGVLFYWLFERHTGALRNAMSRVVRPVRDAA
ncbi:acyltransferase [Variovorax dokdonensis]|uniref:Acyltransferase n=1 Tax=Variovorax dokdonensis TaxID=344883 RepID=A0ABT7N634_9BURK|nr:acyltransferase [Variovorax dokdonensis]MDM0043404.1 acyltransferase [Variovorax dokdonensis]